MPSFDLDPIPIARRWAVPLTVVGLLLIVYSLTLPPSLTWRHHGADGGDLASAVVQGRLPHPPGFPTYLLLGALFVRFSGGDPARRLSLLSAVAAAGAAGLTTRALLLLLSSEAKRSVTTLAALASGLALGLAPLLWSQALIVEVYAPAAFLSALVIWLVARGAPSWAVGLVWGLGIGLHPTLFFLGPFLIASPFFGDGVERELGLRRLITVGLTAALGWGAMAGPVLLAYGGRPSPWGDVGTVQGWWDFVSGRLYRGYLFALPLAAWPRRLVAMAGLLARQATPAGAALAAWGWNRLRRSRRAWAWGSAAAFAALGLHTLMYNTADSLVYLAPALPLGAIWLGLGVARATAWLRERWRGAIWLVLLLPVLQAALFWGGMDLSDDVAAMAWVDEVVDEAPPGAVVLTAEDAHTFALWYAQDALGMRPDVVVLDVDLWAYGPYRRQMSAALGLSNPSAGLSAEEAALQSARPVFDASGHFQQMR